MACMCNGKGWDGSGWKDVLSRNGVVHAKVEKSFPITHFTLSVLYEDDIVVPYSFVGPNAEKDAIYARDRILSSVRGRQISDKENAGAGTVWNHISTIPKDRPVLLRRNSTDGWLDIMSIEFDHESCEFYTAEKSSKAVELPDGAEWAEVPE